MIKILVFIFTLLVLNEAKFLDLDEEILSRFRREVDDLTLWPEDEPEARSVNVSVLAEIVNYVHRKNCNVSLIGWQHIYDEKGNIVKVDALELAFLVQNQDENFPEKTILDDRANQRALMRDFQFREEIEKMTPQQKQFDYFLRVQEGTKTPKLFHWSPDLELTYFRTGDGLVTFNKTLVAKKDQVKSFIDNINAKKDLLLKPLIVKYDADGKLKTDESILELPSVVAYVVDASNVSDEILLESPKILAHFAVNQKISNDDFLQELKGKFNEAFEEYEWKVVVNPGGVDLTEDVWIRLAFDGFEFYQREKKVYHVYGILKNAS